MPGLPWPGVDRIEGNPYKLQIALAILRASPLEQPLRIMRFRPGKLNVSGGTPPTPPKFDA